jgi:hypothetical protein
VGRSLAARKSGKLGLTFPESAIYGSSHYHQATFYVVSVVKHILFQIVTIFYRILRPGIIFPFTIHILDLSIPFFGPLRK